MAFNQNLGWCVDDAVSLVDAFYGTPCVVRVDAARRLATSSALLALL